MSDLDATYCYDNPGPSLATSLLVSAVAAIATAVVRWSKGERDGGRRLPLASGPVTPEERRLSWDRHGFTVEQLRPDGTWTDDRGEQGADPPRYRAACSCGWRGRDIRTGTGAEDRADAEAAFDEWDQEHFPDYGLRSQGAPDGE